MKKILWVAAVFMTVGLTSTFAQLKENPFNNKLIIVVHMQEYDDKGISKESSADEIEKINEIISMVNPDQVVYSKAVHKILNLTLKKIYVDKQVKDLDDRLEIVNKNIFVDHGGNIFNSDELMEFLKKKNVNQIVIVGRVAEECIKTSILSGLELGYNIYMVPEAIVGKSEKSKLKTISKLKNKGAQELVVG